MKFELTREGMATKLASLYGYKYFYDRLPDKKPQKFVPNKVSHVVTESKFSGNRVVKPSTTRMYSLKQTH